MGRGNAPPLVRARFFWAPVIAAVVVSVALIARVAPAAAASLPRSVSPLPGSTFQGGDGNQADPVGDVSSPPDGIADIDWQGLQAAHRVHHSPDPNAQDSAFAGGTKENDPGNWHFTTQAGGVNPPKDNILDGWTAVDQPGANTFLNVAFTREAGHGTSYIAFELNRDARLWNNGRAMIPCRRTGDILIAFEAHGHDVTIVLQRWRTLTTDQASGCARTGELTDSRNFTANVDLQAAMNEGDITNYLPGFKPVPGTIADATFGEASINLARVLNQAFGDSCLAFSSVWMHSRSSNSEHSDMHDYVAPRPLAVRTCAASGTKFYDLNADGTHQAREPGLPRFLIWADYNNDGIQESNEPFSVTDSEGNYVIYDIKPPNGIYWLRETLLTSRNRRLPFATDWNCSFPNSSTPGGTGTAPGGRFGCAWGPIDVNATPNATGRDFGNWYPATLTVQKQLWPTDDPGRFNLFVNDEVFVADAGDNASRTETLTPGTYNVSEEAVSGTNPGDYTSTVDCAVDVNSRGTHRSGPSFTGLTLAAGQQASCVFHNVHINGPAPTPAIAIRKTGPATATAGHTLHYKLYVTNPGEVAFPAAGVNVTDPGCDDPPKLDSKLGPTGAPDLTPGTLNRNPSDTWIYTCSHVTSSGGATCPPPVENTATVTGNTATVTRTSVTDEDSISTDLTCPNRPDPTPEPGPGPGAVQPPGPTPPHAGAAGTAGVRFQQSLRQCLTTHVPRIDFSGTRIARVRVFVNGRLRRNLTVHTLQRSVTPRVTLPPGRYRVVVHVTFENGSGTPPVTLSGIVRICGARRVLPRFTG